MIIPWVEPKMRNGLFAAEIASSSKIFDFFKSNSKQIQSKKGSQSVEPRHDWVEKLNSVCEGVKADGLKGISCRV